MLDALDEKTHNHISQTTFYVTDSSAFRNRVLYFRQDDWETLCAPLIDQLSEKTFKEMEKVVNLNHSAIY